MPDENNYGANTQTPGREFYEFLSTSGLLKTYPKFDAETEWEIREQVNVQSSFAGRMLSLFKNNDPDFTNLCQQMDMSVPQMFRTFRKETQLIPFALLVNSAFLQYESLKRCLLFALDAEKLDLKSSRTMYGNIIGKLRQHGMKPHLVSYMDNELRNIIAHGNWYIKEDKFSYLVKEETRVMSYKKLESRTSNFINFANEFFKLYWKDYIREEHIFFASTKKIEEGL